MLTYVDKFLGASPWLVDRGQVFHHKGLDLDYLYVLLFLQRYIWKQKLKTAALPVIQFVVVVI